MKMFSSCVLSSLVIGLTLPCFAQILPREDKDAGLEDLYDKFEDQESSQNTKKKEAAAKADATEKKEVKDLTKISELGALAPFEDIAVIQKRYLPKTSRFEASVSGLMSTNNAFFNDLGLALRIGYFLNEKYGIEATYIYLTSSDRPITKGLFDNQHVSTKTVVKPESYMGANFKWTPLYGKMAWFQKKIIPFDIYFTPGVGIAQTKGGSSAAFSLGMGQLFALTKSYGVRWDFNWNFYNADVEVVQGTQTTKSTQQHNDLYLGVGMSFLFPEATYR